MLTADTSFIFSFYGADVNTAAAKARLQERAEVLVLPALHRFEFANALRLAVFRGMVAQAEAERRLADFDADVATGLVSLMPLDLNSLLRRAESLSAKHTMTQGQRSMDVLLVAAAAEFNATDFLSFDQRLGTPATAEGLSVGP